MRELGRVNRRLIKDRIKMLSMYKAGLVDNEYNIFIPKPPACFARLQRSFIVVTGIGITALGRRAMGDESRRAA